MISGKSEESQKIRRVSGNSVENQKTVERRKKIRSSWTSSTDNLPVATSMLFSPEAEAHVSGSLTGGAGSRRTGVSLPGMSPVVAGVDPSIPERM